MRWQGQWIDEEGPFGGKEISQKGIKVKGLAKGGSREEEEGPIPGIF